MKFSWTPLQVCWDLTHGLNVRFEKKGTQINIFVESKKKKQKKKKKKKQEEFFNCWVKEQSSLTS